MKKWITSILLMLVMMFGIIGCGDSAEPTREIPAVEEVEEESKVIELPIIEEEPVVEEKTEEVAVVEVVPEPEPAPAAKVVPEPAPAPEVVPEPTPEPQPEPVPQQQSSSGAYAVNGKNGKIHIVGQCPATGTGDNAMDIPVYFNTYEETETYSIQNHASQKKRQCGNCW